MTMMGTMMGSMEEALDKEIQKKTNRLEVEVYMVILKLINIKLKKKMKVVKLNMKEEKVSLEKVKSIQTKIKQMLLFHNRMDKIMFNH